ncbi:hypothetical protein QCD70_06190 [Agreia sp. PsM10]|uniref:hypothetical protein n=1 Tax=Agreia sp. PsM10 TaxID=3030533 RepID=UPI00263ABAAD|nr:hypothetical protein [Agreia sp. PsM10]MDN4639824.1 hypothetical protein [Agreia sp. PsM10]
MPKQKVSSEILDLNYMELRDWAAVVVDVVAITCGVLLVRHRRSAAKFNEEAIRSRGGRLNTKVADSSTPSMAGFAGVVLVEIVVAPALPGGARLFGLRADVSTRFGSRPKSVGLY